MRNPTDVVVGRRMLSLQEFRRSLQRLSPKMQVQDPETVHSPLVRALAPDTRPGHRSPFWWNTPGRTSNRSDGRPGLGAAGTRLR